MPSLSDLAAEAVDLTSDDEDWLHLLLADWQLLADLSFADLVLWLPVRQSGFVVAAQMRPTTGPTALHDDLVGTVVPRGRRVQVDTAFAESRFCRERDPDWPGNVPVREETFPVVRAGKPIAVVSRHTNLAASRTPSRLELTYLRCADDLAVMVAEGRFPIPGQSHRVALAPRVGDGLIRLDATGRVSFASPNALSAYRRLGLAADLTGSFLGEVTVALTAADPSGEPVDEALDRVVSGAMAREAEVESGGAVVRLRVIPLVPGGERTGALVLCRDVTELRRRERELVGKEATIREIHHRVKNNLQTVAALLRLQSRRLGPVDASAKAALGEAERRIAAIALVHETLAGRTGAGAEDAVNFDEVADRLVGMVGEVGLPALGGAASISRSGSFGSLPPAVATPLALVLAELVQNAVEHGRLDGDEVRVMVQRPVGRLLLRVEDDGAGLPVGFDAERDAGLGLQIFRTLVAGELGGTLRLLPGRAGGTVAEVDLPVTG